MLTCIVCNEPLTKNEKKYCSTKCQQKKANRVRIDGWYAGTVSGIKANGQVPEWLRRHLIYDRSGACEVCNFDRVHPTTGASILEIHHIDGDCMNNRPDNIQVLCPNCHAMTDTYRAKNVGNGKRVRYNRGGEANIGDVQLF